MMKARGTYFVPTLMAVEGLKERLSYGYLPPAIKAKARAATAALDNTVRKAIAKGVKIAVGTDADVYPRGRNAGEFKRLAELGMKPVDALRPAPARAWTSRDLGSYRYIGTRQAGGYRGGSGQSAR